MMGEVERRQSLCSILVLPSLLYIGKPVCCKRFIVTILVPLPAEPSQAVSLSSCHVDISLFSYLSQRHFKVAINRNFTAASHPSAPSLIGA